MWSFWVHALLPEVFLEAVPLSLGRGVTVYIPPPPYLALTGLGMVVVVAIMKFSEKQPFERPEVSRKQALKMFSNNKFKVKLLYLAYSVISVNQCAVKIKLPHRGNASGANYEVREIDTKDFLSICNVKIKVDQVGLLEDDSSAVQLIQRR
ncbi:hypothetical protein Tco_1097992, partial [Tanacetum coccineum]